MRILLAISLAVMAGVTQAEVAAPKPVVEHELCGTWYSSQDNLRLEVFKTREFQIQTATDTYQGRFKGDNPREELAWNLPYGAPSFLPGYVKGPGVVTFALGGNYVHLQRTAECH